MEDLKRVYVTKDDDGHNYVIPYELKDDFQRTLDYYYESTDAQDHFEKTYAKYATGGDINLIELYARI